MKLLVQPDSGVTPIISAIKHATTSIDVLIFRADLKEFQQALERAVERGVAVHALIAHTNRGGEKRLRKLEQALLEAGVTVSRTGDDLVRYHGKMMIIDRRTLYTLGFNFTFLDVFKSRSFGVVTRNKGFVQEALKLFQADALRQPYVPGLDSFIVSPENSRERLGTFLKGARKHLLIYDPKICDGPMIRVLQERRKANVDVRILGKLTSGKETLLVDKMPKIRLHIRAILRDDDQLFLGSQSLRPLELDRRREIGVIVRDPGVIKQFRTVFEADWSLTDAARRQSQKDEDDEKGETKHEALAASK